MKKLFKPVFLAVIFTILTGCGTGSTQPGILANMLFYSNSQPVHLKGSVDGMAFELEGRIEKGSGSLLMRELVRGSQSHDYFVEAIVDDAGKIVKGAVTKAKTGSMSMYYGSLFGASNSVMPNGGQLWTFTQDLSDRQLQVIRLGNEFNGVTIQLHLVK